MTKEEIRTDNTETLKNALERIKKLEKENTELKEKLEILILVGNIATKGLNDQLTQSKELFKKIEKIVYNGENEIKRLSKIVDILAEAEQFLKAV